MLKSTHIKLSEQLIKELKKYKNQSGEGVSQLIRRLCSDFLNKDKKRDSLAEVAKKYFDFMIDLVKDQPHLFETPGSSSVFYLSALRHAKSRLNKISDEEIIFELTMILEEISYAYARRKK